MNKTRKRWLLFVFALCMVMLAKPTNAMAASKKYVRSLTVAKKTVSIKKGKTKKVAYKVKVKGKASKKVTVKTSNKKVTAKVKGGKIVITAKKAGISKITITTKGKNKKKKKIKKYIKVKISKAATQIPAVEVTRSEWIAVIMKASAYDVQEELFTKDETGKIVYSFSDIQNDANAKIIETAAKYGIIPNENSMFYPDAAADREFAAVTAVRAAGFKAEQANLSCNDRNSLKDRIVFLVDSVEAATGFSGFGAYFTTLLELDALFLNQDRHLNNIVLLHTDFGCKPCPIFDCGASFLLDFNLYRPDIETRAFLSKAQCLPFKSSFTRTVHTAQSLYGKQLEVDFARSDIEPLLDAYLGYYPKQFRYLLKERVLTVLLAQKKKLF